jgi:hypothetical protein
MVTKAPAVVRPLYPREVREKDLITVCAGLARFLRREGFWPKAGELTEFLKADRGGVVDCFNELKTAKLISREAHKNGYSRYHLTARGWELLGTQPIEPWRKPPTTALLRRAVSQAAARILIMESHRNYETTYEQDATGAD